MALDDVKVGRLEARLTDASTYTYDIKIDIVDTAAADLGGRSDDWSTLKKVDIRLSFTGSNKWENGSWKSASFNGYGADESLGIYAGDGTKKKKKGDLVFAPTSYPPPPSGIPPGSGTDGSSIFAQLSLALNDENGSANNYTLALELQSGEPVELTFAENSQVPGSKVIVAVTGVVSSSTTLRVDFDDVALNSEGVAIFVIASDQLSGGSFSKNTKDGVVYFKPEV